MSAGIPGTPKPTPTLGVHALQVTFAPSDIVALTLGLALASAELASGHTNFTLNNLIACLVASDILQLVGLRSFRTAVLLLAGLLIYDVFWVFASPSVIGAGVAWLRRLCAVVGKRQSVAQSTHLAWFFWNTSFGAAWFCWVVFLWCFLCRLMTVERFPFNPQMPGVVRIDSSIGQPKQSNEFLILWCRVQLLRFFVCKPSTSMFRV